MVKMHLVQASFEFLIAPAKPQLYVIYSFVQSTSHENAHEQYKYQRFCLDFC